jgi:ribonuclease P protein component
LSFVRTLTGLAVTSFRFPHSRRLRSERDFERIYALKQRAGDSHLLVFAAANRMGTTRIGLSVSRRHGNSVARHRIRRLLKEAYRLSQHDVPEGLDLILIPRENSGAGLAEYQASLVSLTKRLARRLLASDHTPRASSPAPEPDS